MSELEVAILAVCVVCALGKLALSFVDEDELWPPGVPGRPF